MKQLVYREGRFSKMNYVLEDTYLFNLLGDIGHQVEGYNFTKQCNESKDEYRKWDDILVNRRNRLNKNIEELIAYIQAKYNNNL